MKRKLVSELKNSINEKVNIQGWIHKIRKLKAITFVILRDRSGSVQCIVNNNEFDLSKVRVESVVSIIGEVKESKNALNPFEIQVENLEVISNVEDELPIEINKEDLEVNLDTLINNRVLSIRHPKINAIFKVQNSIVNGFREFLNKEGFTEIHTPKIVKEGAEGGTEVFEVKYFENKAYLAQSPQFYKQMMVGAGFERVFEVGHAYRAEEHNTNRHLNEYISMDLEMGFIEDEKDIMKLEEGLLKFILEILNKECKEYLNLLQAELPIIHDEIPKLKFKEALGILSKEYNKNDLEVDLDPEGEKLLCEHAKEKLNSDFIFLTNYPRKKRPMYTMPLGEEGTHSFDLLFRGIEITTGGQRIHNYNMLVENMKYKGFNPNDYDSYLSIFKYGMPIHGGLAIGLERITAKILGLENVREATLITRDRKRLVP
ncbi:nondiscriminating aspartyl-tRNA synthetase [Clostridium tetanomorphum]|uniref:Aspartate--tRNA ligase n=1 Tax=Clostridium tetanomorphum TaxID=1553 RepID=A0A923E5H5_CLOTT|nr:aspartate--tRNA(Asn) ligase [Clostridium tetanomorphum]KAJ49248.1 aspartyl-tRNA ligase [Clostridium tetanomorphum DSM 665]KAJ52728.1 aspartyl-tRNA ligase [Clostridium tetanomorphum DSM 665]MBC2396718.1 aspartate--tRNA(Asn) ligase [Clostridium tetanomorphum]MBP1863323.1 nondiscriminating aspartyl-tRNA synthetase [Clostridium tetanomorphum]NRS84431.1 nondiscriminating aspartyl-tRNA synthetase [Clostridium tetanomorphum]